MRGDAGIAIGRFGGSSTIIDISSQRDITITYLPEEHIYRIVKSGRTYDVPLSSVALAEHA